MLVLERGNTTAGYAAEEAPPPDADFTTSAKIMATVMIAPPTDRSALRMPSRVRLRMPVPIVWPPCDEAYRVRRNSPTSP